MSVLSWLFDHAPDVDTPAPPIEPPSTRRHVPVPTPETDVDEPTTEDVDGGELDEVFGAIEYEDAAGNVTRRRITTRRLIHGPTAPILQAICHERRAVRHFRADRIICFITTDGEVIDTDAFFREKLGIDLGAVVPDQALETARYLRERLRAPLSILVAAARSDGEFHPEELDAIERFAEEYIVWMRNAGRLIRDLDEVEPVHVGVRDLDALNRMIANMRPQRRSLKGYLTRIMEMDERPFSLFLRFLEAVIAGDGELAPEELDFLHEIYDIRHPETGMRLTFDP